MASWFRGLSSTLGSCLGQISHSVVSFTRHISRCTIDVWMMEYKTEESNELRRKEVETTKESIRQNVERVMTFYSDVDLQNKQETTAYNDLLIKRELDIKFFIGKEILEKQKLQNLQEDTQSVNAAAGFVLATSSTLLGENIDPKGSEYKHELEQKSLEMTFLRERHEAMKFLKLQKATESINVTASLVPAMPASISLGDNIDQNASEYEHQLEQQNLQMKILRGRNVAMKRKLLKLQKATECLNAAAGLLPATSSTKLDENIDPVASEYEHELEQRNREVKIQRGRNVAMKHKSLKLQKATQCLNVAAGPISATPASNSLAENIDHKASEYKSQLEQQNLEMKILRGRNVAMKHKFLKLLKATQCQNVAAGLVPKTSSASLGENTDANASECKHELEQQNLEMTILRERHEAMKHKFLKLQKATESINATTSLVPVVPASISLGDNIDHNASEYEHQLEQQNLEMKILKGRNVAMKGKLLKLQKATECLNAAASLLPATSSTSLGENINPVASEYEHELEQKSCEVKIQRGRNVAMKHKLLKLQKATQCLNVAAGHLPATPASTSLAENIDHKASEYEHELEQKNLEMTFLREKHKAMKRKFLQLQKATESINATTSLVPVVPASISLGDNINHNASEYEHQLEQQNLEMKILKGRNVAMKGKLLKLQKATECLNAAAGLLPATSSTSLGENINPVASEYEHALEQKNREVKIQRGRNIAMRYKLLKLQKATQCLNVAAGHLPATPASTSLAENIDHKASEYKSQLEQQNLEMKILRGRNVAMKHKLLKLLKATQCLNEATGLVPATSSASLGENTDVNVSECKHELEQQNLEMTILRERHEAMKHKFLQLQKATESINVTTSLVPVVPASVSLGDNIDHNTSEYEHQLEQQNLEIKILKGRNVAMKSKLLKLQKATECLNAAAGLLPAMSSTSLGENIDPIASEYEHELEQKNRKVKIQRGRNIAMRYKSLKLQKATQCLNVAAGHLPATPASTSLAESIDHKPSEYKSQLEQQNLEMKILRGRNVAMKHKLLKLLKAIQCLNEATGLVPAMSSASLSENADANASECKCDLEQKNLEVKILRERHGTTNCMLLKLENATESINMAAGLIPATSTLSSLGENIDPSASEYEHELEQKNLEMTFLREKHEAMKRKFLKLQKATESINMTATLVPAMPASISLGDNIDYNASEYKHQLEKQNLEVKILKGRNVAMKGKLLKLQKATECLNAAAGLLPATSSTSLGENIDPVASEYEHALEQKNREVKIQRGRNIAMKHKLLKLQKATQCLNVAAGHLPATPASTSLAENIDHKASEYKSQLEQQNLEMKILRGRNVAMKHKLLKLLKATQCLNEATGLVPATSSASLGENTDANVSECKHELEQQNLEMTILRERHEAMKHKFLKLQKATESINVTTSLVPVVPASIFLGDNIDHNASEYEHQLEQQNLEIKILKGRNIAMKGKLLKLQKATECLNVAAGLLPAMSSTSLGENINPVASEYEHELEQKNREVKIQRGRNIAMKHKLLKLQKATQCLNVAAGHLPATPASTSLAENIDHKPSEYKSQLEQQNLEMKILRGRNVAMKHKLLKLLKATQCLNEATGLVPATSSASLGENADANASECKRDLEQKNLEVKILRERHGTTNCMLLKLENATESINMAAGLIPATSTLSSLGENIDPSASEYEHELEQKNLEMTFLREKHEAMKRKFLKLQKATESINMTATLVPAMPASISLGDNIDYNASEYKHQLEKQNLEVKILKGRNVAMKGKLLKLQKATECLNAAAGLLPATSSTSLGENIDPVASEYEHALEQKNREVKIQRGRNIAMKHKLLKLQKATQCLNVAAGHLPATPASTSLAENIDHKASEYKSQLEQQNLEMKILRGRNVAMKHKLLKLLKATQCQNAAAGLVRGTSSASLVENIDSNVSEYKYQLLEKNQEMKVLRETHAAMKHKFLKLQKTTEFVNAASGLIPAMPDSSSLGYNAHPNALITINLN